MNLQIVLAMSIALIFSVNCSSSKNRFPTKSSSSVDRESGEQGSGIPGGNEDPGESNSPIPAPSPTPVALTGNQKVVNDAYVFFFNRNAEDAGLDYWVTQIIDRGDNDQAVETVLADIIIAANTGNGDRAKVLATADRIKEAISLIEEADKTFPSYLRVEYVKHIYQKYFARAPDSAGLDFWLGNYDRADKLFSANLQFEADILFGAQGVDQQTILNDSLRRAWAEEIFDLVDARPSWYP